MIDYSLVNKKSVRSISKRLNQYDKIKNSILVSKPHQHESKTEIENVVSLKKKLSQIDWSFTDSNTSYLTHGIHPYPAKFIPQIASNLIKILSLPGETIWDPFCGSGTTALESILAGRHSVNTDINPLSKIIGEAKTTFLDKDQIEDLQVLIEKLNTALREESLLDVVDERILKMGMKIPEIPNIAKWFHENAIQELAIIGTIIADLKNAKAKNIAYLALSKTISKVSNQDEETRYVSKPRRISKKYTLRIFLDNVTNIYDKLIQLKTELGSSNVTFVTTDLRKNIVGEGKDYVLKKNSIDLIVTSPPYPNATDYHLYQRFRLFWLGFDPRELARVEIGSHLRHQKEKTGFEQYLQEIELCMTNMFSALKNGRYAVMIVGDAVFNKKIFKTAESLSDLAQKIGFEPVMIIERPLHKTKRSFVKPGRRAKTENILVLRKP